MACRLLRWLLHPAGSFRAVALGARLCRLRAIPVVRPASFCALASLALAAVLFAVPAEQARAHDVDTATRHAAALPLHDAVRAGDLDSVNHFIAEHQGDAKADVNRASGSGVTPLHWAADGGDVAIAAALLAAGADVSLTTGGGQTPLHWAANGGHAAVVATLLAAGAEVNAKSDDGGTPLRFAAGGGHVSAVAELLAAGAEVDVKNDDGETPLHWAARNGRAAVVATLLAEGAEVNAKNDDGEAPLHLAADGGHAAVVAALIAAGGYWGEAACVSGSVVNPEGPSPPCLCAPPTVGTPGNCVLASAKVTLASAKIAFASAKIAPASAAAAPAPASAEDCEELDQFYDAARSACVPFVECAESEVLYKDANDCHAADAYPLHAAVNAGDLTLVNHFIAEHQGNVTTHVNRATRSGLTPLHYAANVGHAAIAAALLAAGGGGECERRRR